MSDTRQQLIDALRETEPPTSLSPHCRDPRYIRDLGRWLRAGAPLEPFDRLAAAELLMQYARFLPVTRAAVANAVAS